MRVRTLPLMMLAAGLFLAACGGGEGPSDAGTAEPQAADEQPVEPAEPEASEEPVEPADEEAAPTEDAAGEVDLAVGVTDLGEILVDGDGMTLYLFTEDPPGESACVDDCVAAWPPLLVDGDPQVGEGVDPGLVGTIAREDGSVQITYDGSPLYTWASDSAPGEVTGQDVQGVWFVVAADGTAVMDGGDEAEDAGRGPSY